MEATALCDSNSPQRYLPQYRRVSPNRVPLPPSRYRITSTPPKSVQPDACPRRTSSERGQADLCSMLKILTEETTTQKSRQGRHVRAAREATIETVFSASIKTDFGLPEPGSDKQHRLDPPETSKPAMISTGRT